MAATIKYNNLDTVEPEYRDWAFGGGSYDDDSGTSFYDRKWINYMLFCAGKSMKNVVDHPPNHLTPLMPNHLTILLTFQLPTNTMLVKRNAILN